MRILALSATAVALTLSSNPAHAVATLYSNRTLFEAAAGSLTAVDFQGCSGGSLATNQTVSSNSGGCSGIPQGVTFSPLLGGNLYVASALQSGNPTTALGVDTPVGGVLGISLATLSTAFSLDLFQNYGGGSQGVGDASFLISFFNGGSLVGSYAVPVAANTGSYFGLVGTDAFNRIRVSQSNGYAVIDNVSYNKVAAVPEPATWIMMMLGFGAIGFALRRKPSNIPSPAA